MSTTTELLLFQAAAAPTGASALGIPASDADYEAFAETLKTELGYGQSGAKTGNSLPQKGESVPANTATSPSSVENEGGSASPVQAVTDRSQGAARDTGSVSPDTAAPMAGDGPQNSSTESDLEVASESGVSSRETDNLSADSPLAKSAQWNEVEVSDRLKAIEQLFANYGGSNSAGSFDSEVQQKLALSALSLDAIEQRLAKLAQAEIIDFENGVSQGDAKAPDLFGLLTASVDETGMPAVSVKAASLSSSVAPAETGDLLEMAQVIRQASSGVSDAASSSGINALAANTASVVSARSDTISNMMASSGQGEISGTLSADLQQILATGDETLEAIQVRLQTLSKEGVTLFNKENYFNNPRLAGSALTAQHASGSAPVLTHADPILTGRTETGLTLASGGDKQVSGVNAPNAAAANASQRTNVGALDGIEIDPRRAVVTLTSSKSQQAATRSEATHVDTIMRTSSLLADEVRRALASVKRGDAASAAREPASPVLDRSTAITLSPAQMAAQRQATVSAQAGAASDASGTSETGARNSALAAMSASGGSEMLRSVDAERSRMAASTANRAAAPSAAPAADLLAAAQGQGAMQDAHLDTRVSQDLSGSRSVSFELPSSTQPASLSANSVATPGLAASNAANTATGLRTGGDVPMQNAAWSPQFSEELGERVRVFVNNGLQEARLQLTPADLGRVQITINTEGDHARVVFVAETALARDLLDQSMPRLREMLQQSGIQLAQGDVSDQAESQAEGERLQADADGGSRTDSDGQPAEAESSLVGTDRPTGGQEGRVDTYI